MTERLLQFIWQFQYFNKNDLVACSGEKLEVLAAGQLNYNQGPDFTDARIRINNATWVGTIELHLKTSGWTRHHHEHDPKFRNVVLHVVWENDDTPNTIPVLELQSRVPKFLLHRYQELMESAAFIPCEKNLHGISPLRWTSWKDRLIAERLFRKAAQVRKYLEENNYHWEETFWWLLARNFGMKVNAEPFELMARSIPLHWLAKQKPQIHQLEALLLGQTGLLEKEFEEDYPRLLQREYRFQQSKLGIRPIPVPVLFLRMRPGNFPSVRLAQLAMLVHDSARLFSRIREAGSVKEIRAWLDVTANDYWHYHYQFDERSGFRKKKLGSQMVSNIIINTVIPVLFTYGDYHGDNKIRARAVNWLEETMPESNNITSGFVNLGLENRTAFDSQAYIELKTQYCDAKKCLDCGIGNAILRRIK